MEGKDRGHHHEAAQNRAHDPEEGHPTHGRRKVGLRIEVGPVGDHGARAQGEREEAEAHGVEERCAVEVFPTGQEQVLHAFPAARERHAADDQDDHQDEERRHEDLRELFNPRFDPAQDDDGREKKEGEEVAVGHGAVRNEAAEVVAEERRILDDPDPGDRVDRVLEAPAADAGVEGQNQKDRQYANPAEDPPGFAADVIETSDRAATTGTTHRKFRNQEGNAHRKGKEDVGEHKDRPAVGAGHVRELPDRAQPDGRARAGENEAEAGAPAGCAY